MLSKNNFVFSFLKCRIEKGDGEDWNLEGEFVVSENLSPLWLNKLKNYPKQSF